MAAEYKIERALERNITESFQGRTLEVFKDEMHSIEDVKAFTMKYGFENENINVQFYIEEPM